jgi:hypothetical protein
MSHLTKVQVKVDSMDLLKRTLDRMGKAYKEDTTTIKDRYNNSIKCELYLSEAKVGFRKEEGGYVAESDWYYSGLNAQTFTKEFNENVSLIKVEDACQSRHLKMGRWQRNDKGNLVMVASSWS